ncbi:MAG: hypothetical protein R3348_04030, partial [Xanthomonadales bacterium]|nr:hypothetical protein [Xanthomonadales bacterium]
MPEHWRILKVGGTCVDSAASWQRIAGLVRQRHADGDRPLLVCSALVGVTERLLRVEPDSDAARSDKAWFLGRHAELAVALKIEAGDLLSELEHRFDAALARMSAGGGSPARAEL